MKKSGQSRKGIKPGSSIPFSGEPVNLPSFSMTKKKWDNTSSICIREKENQRNWLIVNRSIVPDYMNKKQMRSLMGLASVADKLITYKQKGFISKFFDELQNIEKVRRMESFYKGKFNLASIEKIKKNIKEKQSNLESQSQDKKQINNESNFPVVKNGG